ERERRGVAQLRSRPVLADPMRPITVQREELVRLKQLMRRDIRVMLDREISRVSALRSQVGALGPAATLARGYSVVQVLPRDRCAPGVAASLHQAPPAAQLRARVGDGSLSAAGLGSGAAD